MLTNVTLFVAKPFDVEFRRNTTENNNEATITGVPLCALKRPHRVGLSIEMARSSVRKVNSHGNQKALLKFAAALSGATGVPGLLTSSIQRAYAIEPEPGSSYIDAEHIVILMQENRSFDHTLGTLQGVRGFNDPRAIRLANGNSVFVQNDECRELLCSVATEYSRYAYHLDGFHSAFA